MDPHVFRKMGSEAILLPIARLRGVYLSKLNDGVTKIPFSLRLCDSVAKILRSYPLVEVGVG
jgi:hypothetical protein